MKVTELRIGNWIYAQGIENQVTDLTWRHGEFETNGTMLVECEPIPLTEEWLKRFGFWFNEDSDYYHCGDNEEIRIDSSDLAFCYGDSWNFPKVEHVHQLQNLYFALTGEELNQNKEDED